MSRKLTLLLVLCGALTAQFAHAAPILTVAPNGTSGGNRLWAVNISPDASLFSGSPPGGSLAVELAFTIDDPVDLLNVAVADPAVWDSPNPGNNPFTGTVTNGTYIDLVNDRSFSAYGSVVLHSASPTHFLTITTAGLGFTTLRYGTAASGTLSKGNIIAQAGQNFTGYTGVVSVPEPATCVLAVIGMASVVTVGRRRRIA